MPEQDLNRIRQAVFQLINVRSQVDKIEESLKKTSQQLRILEFEVIPTLMHELNLEKIVLDGISLQLKPFYRASIPINKRPEAFEWLRSNGFASLIKREIRTKFVRGQDRLATKLIRFLVENGWVYEDSEQVNTSTLSAWLREQMEAGNVDLPLETLGAFIGERATLKVVEGE